VSSRGGTIRTSPHRRCAVWLFTLSCPTCPKSGDVTRQLVLKFQAMPKAYHALDVLDQLLNSANMKLDIAESIYQTNSVGVGFQNGGEKQAQVQLRESLQSGVREANMKARNCKTYTNQSLTPSRAPRLVRLYHTSKTIHNEAPEDLSTACSFETCTHVPTLSKLPKADLPQIRITITTRSASRQQTRSPYLAPASAARSRSPQRRAPIADTDPA
jgi:hypothetical protein